LHQGEDCAMNKAAYGRPLFVTLAIVSMLLLIVGTVVAKERQLAGVALNDHAIDLLDIYGPPDGVVTGPAGDPFADLRAQQIAAMIPGMAGAPGMPGMAGAPGMPGMAGAPGMPGMAGAPGVPGMAGPLGAFPGAAAPGAAGMQGAAAAGQVQPSVVPNWALPVYISTQPGEIMWIYQRGPITLGFLLDLDGYVQDIAVAADKCNYARTANWQPHKYVKLGDHYSRVLQRYGWPDETNTYTASGVSGGAGGGAMAAMMGGGMGMVGGAGGALAAGRIPPGLGGAPTAGQMIGGGAIGGAAASPSGTAAAPSVTFSGTTKTFSRDCVLRYTENGNNIDFTLHDFRVVRIHIWD